MPLFNIHSPGETRMNAKWTAAVLLALLMTTAHVSAQTDDPLASATIQAALAAPPRHLQAQIIGIDTSSRTLTLKGAKGHVIPAVIGKQVTNFDTLKVGDRVDVLFKDALLLQAVKTSAKGGELRKRVDTSAFAPASDAAGFGSVKEVEIIATVQSINKKNKTITLRGPWHTDTFHLTPQLAAQKLKAGDMIHAVFISAVAVEVTPVNK
jgi:Cu/Ag efflux protein CusF